MAQKVTEWNNDTICATSYINLDKNVFGNSKSDKQKNTQKVQSAFNDTQTKKYLNIKIKTLSDQREKCWIRTKNVYTVKL